MNIGEAVDVQMGYPFRGRLEADPNGDVAVLQMKDIAGNALPALPPDVTILQLAGRAERYLLKVGDVIFRSRGQTTATLITADLGPVIIAAPMMRLRLRSPGVRPEYLAWYINQPKSQAYLRSELRGTSVLMISTESLKRLGITVPSVQRQEAIVRLANLGAAEQELMAKAAKLRQRRLEEILWQCAQDSQAKRLAKGGGRGASTPLPPFHKQ
jgi:hypothetical protein